MKWFAYLGDQAFPEGEGDTKEEAIQDAVLHFEVANIYDDNYPNFPSREAYIEALSVCLEHDDDALE